MSVRVEQISPSALLQTIGVADNATFQYWLTCTHHLWAGFVDEDLACAWGLVPPTLLSDSALLWLYTTPVVDDHKFLFIRRSRMAIESMLKLYPRITGVTLCDAERSIRWIRWLGGAYGKREGKFMPFTIEGRAHG